MAYPIPLDITSAIAVKLLQRWGRDLQKFIELEGRSFLPEGKSHDADWLEGLAEMDSIISCFCHTLQSEGIPQGIQYISSNSDVIEELCIAICNAHQEMDTISPNLLIRIAALANLAEALNLHLFYLCLRAKVSAEYLTKKKQITGEQAEQLILAAQALGHQSDDTTAMTSLKALRNLALIFHIIGAKAEEIIDPSVLFSDPSSST